MEETQNALPYLLQTAEKLIQRNQILPALEF